MAHYHDLLKDLAASNRQLRDHIGETFGKFAELHKAALSDGALSGATKELVALGMAIAQQCDGCIASHARGAARKGASPEEVAEVIGVALLMMGGPATVYGPRAWDAFIEFAAGS